MGRQLILRECTEVAQVNRLGRLITSSPHVPIAQIPTQGVPEPSSLNRNAGGAGGARGDRVVGGRLPPRHHHLLAPRRVSPNLSTLNS